ncbi:ABC transporter ATP-binding protein [Bacillota bacterium Meth-B3]
MSYAGNILDVRDLSVGFFLKNQVLTAVDRISLKVGRREILGIVGESGSGKSQAMLAVMRLTQPPGRICSGSVTFQGEDLLQKSDAAMRAIRGKKISMIFQDPMAALDPIYTCGFQITETILRHERCRKKEAAERGMEMLRSVGLPDPKKIMRSYPFELSGGMCQRVMIAMSLVCSPELLIADEPTTALDVTVQAQILELLLKIREERNMSIVLITHDLGVVSEITDRVVILYAGKLMEQAPTAELMRSPAHPYTRGLLRSVVQSGMDKDRPLPTIRGTVPEFKDMPEGCRFATRCPDAQPPCHRASPARADIAGGHIVYCHRFEDRGEDNA